MNATALQEARKDALAAEQARLKAEERAAGQAEGQSEGEEEEDDDDEDLADENSGRATPPPDTPQITDDEDETDEGEDGYASDRDYLFSLNEEDTEDGRDPRARVLSVLELEDLIAELDLLQLDLPVSLPPDGNVLDFALEGRIVNATEESLASIFLGVTDTEGEDRLVKET